MAPVKRTKKRRTFTSSGKHSETESKVFSILSELTVDLCSSVSSHWCLCSGRDINQTNNETQCDCMNRTDSISFKIFQIFSLFPGFPDLTKFPNNALSVRPADTQLIQLVPRDVVKPFFFVKTSISSWKETKPKTCDASDASKKC